MTWRDETAACHVLLLSPQRLEAIRSAAPSFVVVVRPYGRGSWRVYVSCWARPLGMVLSYGALLCELYWAWALGMVSHVWRPIAAWGTSRSEICKRTRVINVEVLVSLVRLALPKHGTLQQWHLNLPVRVCRLDRREGGFRHAPA